MRAVDVKSDQIKYTRARTPGDCAMLIEKIKKIEKRFHSEPFVQHWEPDGGAAHSAKIVRIVLCELWIREHCRKSGKRLNHEMSAEAFAHDVRRWLREVSGRHYDISADDFICGAVQLKYLAVHPSFDSPESAYRFNMVPKE